MKTRKILAAAMAMIIACSAPTYLLDERFNVPGNGNTVHAESEYTENPFNYRDDMEVPYNGSYWRQPKEWNMPKLDPKKYVGGVMLYFDKIGLEPDYARGKTQRVYFNVTDITEPVNTVRFHMFYDTRLKIVENDDGKPVTNGKAFKDFSTDSVLIEEGQIEYYAYSDNASPDKGSVFTVDFIVPENAGPGEVYPFGIVFVTDDGGPDLFLDKAQSDAGKLQMAYVFTKGIYNGYIRMQGEKPTTTVAATTTAPLEYRLGDPTGDSKIDSSDATFVLVEYASSATGGTSTLTEEERNAADVNKDSKIDSKDASSILSYYSYASTGGKDSIEDFLSPKEE